MEFSVETVTPELAKDWLGKNLHNRSMNKERAKQFAGAMSRGEWRANGETIKFAAKNGDQVLIDGQKRILAVLLSGMTVEMPVVRGLSMDVQDTVDLGEPRRLSHSLQLRGEKNAQSLAGIVSGYFRYCNRTFDKGGAAAYPTPTQGIAFLEEHPDLRDATNVGKKLNEQLRVLPVAGGVCFYEFGRLDSEDQEVFLERLIKGVELEETSPILQLRLVLERFGIERLRGRGQRRNQVDYAAHIIKAWNAWRRGESIQRLVWYRGGSKREPFPIAE